jgi:predicted MFS family arabinose efflux permease
MGGRHVSDVSRPSPLRVDSRTLRGRALLPVLVFIGLLASVVSSLGAPLIPTIAEDYGIAAGTAQWMLTISLLTGAISTPVIGRLGDGPYRLHTLLACLALMASGCLLAALPSPTFGFLLTGRALQGFGLSLLPLIIGIARDHLEPERTPSAFAALSISGVVGVGLGYPITGVIAEYLTYRLGFWLAMVLAALALILATLIVPPSMHHMAQQFDATGAILLTVGLCALLLGISQGEDWGWASTPILGLLIGSCAVLIIWSFQQLRSNAPLIELRLLRQRAIAAANAIALLAGIGMYILMSIVVRFTQTPETTGYGLEVTVLVGSLALVPMSLGSYLASRLTAFLIQRVNPGFIVVLGTLAFISAMITFMLSRTALWQVLVVMGLAGMGIGCSFAVLPAMIVNYVPPESTGSILAMNQVLRQLGFATGSALSATILSAYTPESSLYPVNLGYSVCAGTAIGLCALAAMSCLLLPPRRSAN